MTDEELKGLFDEMRRHFDVTAEHLQTRLSLVAESVLSVDETLGRRIGVVEQTVERTAADTQAMIKFSHSELDRRVRSLEESRRTLEESQRSLEGTVAELQSRIQRLESSTH